MDDSQQPVDKAFHQLEDMVNTVLVSVGRIFVDPSKRTGQSSQETKSRLRNAMPLAMNNFHQALDVLEGELFRANAVMRRDLAVFQADREKREQADAAERQRAVAEPSPEKAESPQHAPGTEPVKVNDAPAPAEDVTMTDEPQQNGDHKSTDGKEAAAIDVTPEQPAATNALEATSQDATEQSASADDTTSAPSAMQIDAEAPDPSAPTSQPQTEDAKPDTQAEESQAATHDATLDDLFDSKSSPTTGGVQDFDFDSIFNDLPSAGGDNTNNDYDFSFPASATDNDDATNNNNDDDDVSLLPGLESYANIAGGDEPATANQPTATMDLGMLDLPAQDGQSGSNVNNPASTDNNQQTNGVAPDGGADHQAQTRFRGDATFDELFGFDDFSGDATAEDTAFDDALFGFEEGD